MNNAELVYRDYVIDDDLEAVRRIATSSGFFSPREIDVAVELVEDRLRKGAASDYRFLFISGHEGPLAFTCYGPIACTASSYDLYWIAVDQPFRDSGIGRRLLERTEQMIRGEGGRRIYAETSSRPQYEPTRRFYEAHKYRREALLRDFYACGDHKLVYLKILDERPALGRPSADGHGHSLPRSPDG